MVQSEDRRYCRICELARDVPEEIGVYADRLYQSMPDRERASETQIKERLSAGPAPISSR